MDMDKFEEMRKEMVAKQEAMNMLFDMLETIMPDDFQPMIQLPKFCDSINRKTSTILRLVGDREGFGNSAKLASEANILLSRVDEALDAFIEQNREVSE